MEAEIVRAKLEAAGIEAAVILDDIGGMYPAVGGARLLVREEDADRAESVLSE